MCPCALQGIDNPDTTFRVGGGVTPAIGLGALLVILLTAGVVYTYW